MKKVVVSLIVLALVALAATGTVSAQCAAKTTTGTNAATTCAQCTSCTTSTCCSCPCPVACCCPTVTCCVVTQCCWVKHCGHMWGWNMWGGHVKPHPEPRGHDGMDGILVKTPDPVRTGVISASASATTSGAANVGSGTASTSQQTITQTQTVGDITGSGNTINFADQTAGNTNVAASHANVNVASAWQGSQAANSGTSTTQTRTVDVSITPAAV